MENIEIDFEQYTKNRILVAEKFLCGKGIEIGALHNPLPLSGNSNIEEIKYVDRFSVPDLRRHYPELNNCNLVNVDIIDNGEVLSTIKNQSLDFIICNHMLEHCENPIGTIRNYLSKLKTGGIIYLAVPDKRFTFDLHRVLTSFDHCLIDDIQGPQVSRATHFAEWVILVNRIPDKDEAIKKAQELLIMNYSIHFHVWDHLTFKDFLDNTNEYLLNYFTIDYYCTNYNEVISILRKV
jgi:SAM-dependent methyltransferase